MATLQIGPTYLQTIALDEIPTSVLLVPKIHIPSIKNFDQFPDSLIDLIDYSVMI